MTPKPQRTELPGARARLDYHDPTRGVGGAAPPASALTLRLILAGAGLLVCVVGIVAGAVLQGPVALFVVLAVAAACALVDLIVITRRKRRGEPG